MIDFNPTLYPILYIIMRRQIRIPGKFFFCFFATGSRVGHDLTTVDSPRVIAICLMLTLMMLILILALAMDRGVLLAPDKEEVQRFTKEREVPEAWKPRATRWLGVWIDTKLDFKEHIRI